VSYYWMQYGGRAYDLGSPSLPKGATVSTIAASLARINRFTGHTYDVYSVAKHSVFVSKLLELDPLAALYGLAHDAHETIVGDINSPLKKFLRLDAMPEFQLAEDAADQACFTAFGLAYPMPDNIAALVKRADMVAVATEKRDLMPECDREWTMLTEPAHYRTVTPSVDPYTDTEAFMQRYDELAKHVLGETTWEKLR
jgi:5'-deoxynucleotidase YfbR-like HD superfamily hydrolase